MSTAASQANRDVCRPSALGCSESELPSKSGADPGICVRGLSPLSYLFSPSPLLFSPALPFPLEV